MSVSAALVVVLAAVVVYLAAKLRRLTEQQPKNAGTVYSNMAFNGDAVNNTVEGASASHFDDVDLGAGTTDTSEQTRQDPQPIYEEASRPLPLIPEPNNATREDGIGEIRPRAAATRASNVSYGEITSTTRAGEESYMGLSPTYGDNATVNVSPGVGAAYYNSYMSLSPERPKDTSYFSINSTRTQASGTKQHGNNGKRRNEINKTYENTGNG